ncbi:MAG: helical backbone metal receptor, partial [Myxococcota bacterium]
MLLFLIASACAAPQWYGTPPVAAERIVSLAPSLTESLFAIGAGAKVVGVSRFDDRPAEVAALPKLGAVGELSVESVLALDPDLVVSVKARSLVPAYQRLAQFGVAVVAYDGERIASFHNMLIHLGGLTGRASAAQAISDELRQALERPKKRPLAGLRVLVLVGRQPLFAATDGSYMGEVVRALGGINVLSERTKGFVPLGAESVLALEPALIIDLSGDPSDMRMPPKARRLAS